LAAAQELTIDQMLKMVEVVAAAQPEHMDPQMVTVQDLFQEAMLLLVKAMLVDSILSTTMQAQVAAVPAAAAAASTSLQWVVTEVLG
jgi:hypothetical protein